MRLKTSQEIFDNIINIDDKVLSAHAKDYILNVIELVKERAIFYKDILIEGQPFFQDEVLFNENAVSKKWSSGLVPVLVELCEQLLTIDDFNKDQIEKTFHSFIKKQEVGLGKIMPMLRIAITGNLSGPSMFESLELIGKEKMKQRIDNAINSM